MRRFAHVPCLRFGSAMPRAAWRRRGRWNFLLRRCFVAACACFSSPGYGVAAERTVDLELVLAVDISESMDMEEAALQRQGFIRAFRHRNVIDAIQRGRLGRIAVTYVEWGSEQYQITRVDWTEVADASSAAAFAKAIERSSAILVSYTSISGAIAFGAQSFEGNGFRGERRIIDISGDGPNNMGASVNVARDRAVADGITINGLPIITDRPNIYGYPLMPDLDLYYEDCVIGGPGAFIVVADGFKDFARAILRKLVTEIAGRASPLYLLRLAAARPRSPCNAGEVQHQRWLEKWLKSYRPPVPLYDF